MNRRGTDGSNCAETEPESSFAKSLRAYQRGGGKIGIPPPQTVTREQAEQRRREEQLRTHQVYFLYGCGRVKIGTSRNHVRRILMDIQPYCPAPLYLIGTIPGGPIVEGGLHARFSAAAIGNEWFDLTPELRALLCENDGRRNGLKRAEESYLEWLREETVHLEKNHAEA